MENLLTYILQVNLLLTIVYGGYYFLLKGLTFYQLNRVYLLVGTIYAAVYPFIDFKSWFRRVEPVTGAIQLPALDWSMPEQESVTYLTLENALLAMVVIGATVLIVKFLIQLVSLMRIHLYSKTSNWKAYFFRDVVFPVVPFSFFNKVYVHKEQHQEVELNDIFEHEYIHVKGLHTIDILWFEMLLIGCWYNPFVWLMRKAVRQNLEFLTDHQVLNKGADRQAYQYSLLNVTKRGAAVGLGNQFNFKTLKKRIMMMNKKRSSRLELSKYAFLLPVMILAGASFTVSKAESTIKTVVEKAQDTKLINEPLAVKMKGEVGQLLKETIGTDIIKIDTTRALKGSFTGVVVRKQNNPDSVSYVLDGKVIPMDELKQINPKEIESLVVNIKNEVTKKYGKPSVVNIETKKFAGTEGTPSQFTELLFDGTHINTFGGKLKAKGGVGESSFTITSSEFNFIKSNDATDEELKNQNGRIKLKGKVEGVKVTKYQDSQTSIFPLKSKSEIDQSKDLLYVYDNKVVSKDEFLKITDQNLHSLTFSNKDVLQWKYPTEKAKDGLISALSDEGLKNLREKRALVLFVIDGKESGKDAVSALDPNDIYSMNVMKDKAAVEKYGSKGKDGVIEIVTKKKAESLIKTAVGKEIEKERAFSGRSQYRTWAMAKYNNPAYIVNGILIAENEYKKITLSNVKGIYQMTKEQYKSLYSKEALDVEKYDSVILMDVDKSSK